MVLPPSLQGSLPAGWLAFTGRELNPLDRDERFQLIFSSSSPGLFLAQRKSYPRVLMMQPGQNGLTLHPDKTRVVDFRNTRPNGMNHPETDGTSFTFLGFTHIWGKSRAGKNVVRQVTAKSRYARALAAVTAWCRSNRHQSIPDQHAHLTAMMRGHYAYYGITGNSRRISWYARQVARIWQKWLSRRDRRNRLRWSRFTALLKRHPLPAARIVHRYTAASEALP